MIPRSATLLFVSVLLASASVAAPASDVRLDVFWKPPGGPESVREAVERAALRAAETEGCVGAVSADRDAPAERIWRIVLVELEEATTYDDSVYEVQVPGEPGKDLLRTSRIRLEVASQLLAADGSASDKVRPLRVEETRRPRAVGEDTPERIRGEVIRRLERELGKSLCRGVKRLSRSR